MMNSLTRRWSRRLSPSFTTGIRRTPVSGKLLSWRRVRAPVRERDAADCPRPQQLADCGGHPLLLLFIFGYGINLDSSKLRVGVLLEQQQEALDFVHTMTGSPYIDATISDNRQELVQMMQAGRIRPGNPAGGLRPEDGPPRRRCADPAHHRRQRTEYR